MTNIIIDFEATCCDQGSLPRDEMEIIEIGAVALQANGPSIQSEFQALIKPVRHPNLTAFCTELTTITQSMVDTAEPFHVVLDDFTQWINSFDQPVFCSWGEFDRIQLKLDCKYHKLAFPFSKQHVNLKASFSTKFNLEKKLPLALALEKMNIEFKGQAHRGLDDARNMAMLAPVIFD